MSSYTLNIKVEGGELSADRSALTADSVDYITAAFTFDESWSNLYKTAIFRTGELVYHAPLENGACSIPFEALKEPIMYISVFGVLSTTRATTVELPIQIKNSGYIACEPSAPTPDPYNFFLKSVTELKNQAEQSAAVCTDCAADIKADKTLVGEMLSNTLDAASRTEQAVQVGLEYHNSADNLSAHPNIMQIANDAKNNFSNYYTKAQIDEMLSKAVFELISQNEYNTLYAEGGLTPDKIYCVFKEE